MLDALNRTDDPGIRPPLLAVGMVDQQIQRGRDPHTLMRRVIAVFSLTMAVLVAGAIGGWLAAAVLLNERLLIFLGIGP